MATVTNVLTDSITINYSGNGKAVVGKVGQYTGNFDVGIAAVIPAGTVNKLFTLTFPFATIQAMVFESSQNLTVLTNSSGSPVNTYNLKGTSAFYWAIDIPHPNPFTVNITSFYVSNSGSVDSTFNFRALYN